jgi:DNA-binding XRE family transcriptional regulator
MLRLGFVLPKLKAADVRRIDAVAARFRYLNPTGNDARRHDVLEAFLDRGRVELGLLADMHWLNDQRAALYAHRLGGDPLAPYRHLFQNALASMVHSSLLQPLPASMTFGARLRELRLRQGMTQAELAGRVHVSIQSVGAWEADRSHPHRARLDAIARVLHCSRRELSGD